MLDNVLTVSTVVWLVEHIVWDHNFNNAHIGMYFKYALSHDVLQLAG